MKKILFKLFLSFFVFMPILLNGQRLKNVTDEKVNYIFTPDIPSKTYATWSSSNKSPNITLSNGNLTVQRNGGVGVVAATIPLYSGKAYYEMKVDAFTGSPDCFLGIMVSSCILTANLGSTAQGWGIVLDGGDYYNNGFIGFAGGSTYPAAVNDVFGFELDLQNHTLTIYRNDVVQTPNPLFLGLGSFYYPAMSVQNNAVTITANFGSSAFTYTGHTGFKQGIFY
jgi:hypothetical protein